MSRLTAIPNPEFVTRASGREWVRALVETTKPGITKLVTITSMVGFILAWLSQHGESFAAALVSGLLASVGTALAAGGANALNQWWESERDARMRRTHGRPLPAERLAHGTVFKLGFTLSLGGTLVLLAIGPVPALVALTCTITYVFIYTPMKPRSAWCTLVGAIPGALPPLIGWTSASGNASPTAMLDPGAQSLFWLMMVWQIPHFMAIAWMFRDDYQRGGMRMLPVIDRTGLGTASVVCLTSALLVPATLAPVVAMPHVLGPVSFIVALVSGLAFLVMSVRLALSRTQQVARRVFFASIMHLPLLLVVMVGEAFVRVVLL
ncbi:MAG: heme o synthase [Phycisphaerales bacterium]|nr:heme o synthase [Phycisphaerales bacterium]